MQREISPSLMKKLLCKNLHNARLTPVALVPLESDGRIALTPSTERLILPGLEKVISKISLSTLLHLCLSVFVSVSDSLSFLE